MIHSYQPFQILNNSESVSMGKNLLIDGLKPLNSDLDDTVTRVLKNEKEYNRIVEKMYDDKLLELLKSKLKLNFTEVSFEDFYHQH